MSFLRSIFGRGAKGPAPAMSLDRMEDVIDAYASLLAKDVGPVESEASLPLPKSEIEAAILMKAGLVGRADRDVLEAAFLTLGNFVPLTDADAKAYQLFQVATSEMSSMLQDAAGEPHQEAMAVLLKIANTNAPTAQAVVARTVGETRRLAQVWAARFG